MTVPSYFNPYDVVVDRNTGIKYIINTNMKLMKFTEEPYDIPMSDEVEYHYSMDLHYHGSTQRKTTRHSMYTGGVKEKPIDIEDRDWEEYKEKNSINIHMAHHPMFDAPVSPVNQASPLESYKFILIDPVTGEQKPFEIKRDNEQQSKA
jgi:hypothetical protein